jgi:hypothetical protein
MRSISELAISKSGILLTSRLLSWLKGAISSTYSFFGSDVAMTDARLLQQVEQSGGRWKYVRVIGSIVNKATPNKRMIKTMKSCRIETGRLPSARSPRHQRVNAVVNTSRSRPSWLRRDQNILTACFFPISNLPWISMIHATLSRLSVPVATVAAGQQRCRQGKLVSCPVVSAW